MQVSPPGLHLSLAIFYRLFTLLETECHQLDLLLATHTQSGLVGPGPSFQTYVNLIQEKEKLTEVVDNLEVESDELEGLVVWFSIHLTDAETNEHLRILREEVIRRKGKKNKCYEGCKQEYTCTSTFHVFTT